MGDMLTIPTYENEEAENEVLDRVEDDLKIPID